MRRTTSTIPTKIGINLRGDRALHVYSEVTGSVPWDSLPLNATSVVVPFHF